MRKAGKYIGQAFREGKSASMGNTSTDGEYVTLHGNRIVKREYLEDGSSFVYISLAGWPTSTTRSRINDILSVLGSNWRVGQKDGLQMIGQCGVMATIPDNAWIKVKV